MTRARSWLLPWGARALCLFLLQTLPLRAADVQELPDAPLPSSPELPSTVRPSAQPPSKGLEVSSPSPEKGLNAPPQRKPWTFLFSARVQPERYDFMAAGPKASQDYAFLGVRARGAVVYTHEQGDARLELQNLLVAGLPAHSVAPSPAGALGQGASYYTLDHHTSFDTLGIRQLYYRWGAPTGTLGSPTGSAFKVGRFDYSSGMEVASPDQTLDWVKRERLSKKVVGQPDYNIFSRSFDGARFDVDAGPCRITGLAVRPTQAEPHFGVEAHSVATENLAVTLRPGTLLGSGEAQVFFNHLDDMRQSLQVDNRPSALRQTMAAEGGNHIDTVGLHYVGHLGTDGDAMVWLAHQGGRWGQQTHDANAGTVELGVRFPQAPWTPWLRGGMSIYSGSTDPQYKVHGTFLSELADPRQRLNVFGFANMHDSMAQIMAYPSSSLTLRLDYHLLSLDSAQDLWYTGSGVAQQLGSNGITGRPSGGARSIGNLMEGFVQQKLDEHSTLQLRLLHLTGGSVVKASFPTQHNAHLYFLQYDYSL